MRGITNVVVSGLGIGAILAVAQYYSQALLPWVLGFMLACLTHNITLMIKGLSNCMFELSRLIAEKRQL